MVIVRCSVVTHRATTEHRATEQLQVLAALGPGLLLVINGIMNS